MSTARHLADGPQRRFADDTGEPRVTGGRKALFITLAVLAVIFALSWQVGLVVAALWALLYIFLVATN